MSARRFCNTCQRKIIDGACRCHGGVPTTEDAPEPWTPALDVQTEGTPSPSRPWIVERVTQRRADGCPMFAEWLTGAMGAIRSFATKEEAQSAADRANGASA